MWTKYTVTMEFLTKICGGVPADPDMVRRWLESRAPARRPAQGRSIDELAEEVLSTLPADEAEPGYHCFQRHPTEKHLVVEMRTIRGHLKDVAGVMSRLYALKVEKESSFAVKVKNAVYYPPEVYWVPILRADGSRIMEPDGTYDKAIHVQTPQGPRSALKTIEYLETGCRIVFPLIVMTTPDVTRKVKDKDGTERTVAVAGKMVVPESDLESIFNYGGVHGYGPERGDGQGRYIATLERVAG